MIATTRRDGKRCKDEIDVRHSTKMASRAASTAAAALIRLILIYIILDTASAFITMTQRPPTAPSSSEIASRDTSHGGHFESIEEADGVAVTVEDDMSTSSGLPPDLFSRFGAVVLLEVSYVEPEYLRPWQKSRQGSCTGTGFVVPDDETGTRRLLTNLHVVQDATDIRVRKHGNSRRWRARVVVKAADVDLAVLQIVSEDEQDVADFWEKVKPVQWGDNNGPPLLQSSVNVVGFPTGGRTICVTEGVVSRIDCRNYRLKTAGAAPGKLLVIQVDSAINPGNSGGPCFDADGRVVGVAFQGLDGNDAQNIGYIIPTSTALNFLAAIEHKDDGTCEYKGVQEIPFRFANLQNKSLRKFLKFDGNSGVVVTKVSPLAVKKNAGNFLQKDDVITHVDGRELGEDYTVALRGDELMNADFLITGKRKGEATTFTVVRDTKTIEITTTLSPLMSNVLRDHDIDCTPEWLVIGGLLFVPLTCPLLAYGTTEGLEASGYLAIYDYMDDELSKFRQDEETEIILLIDILACDTNFGYEFRQRWRKLDTLNGNKLKNMAELYNMYEDACRSIADDSDDRTDFLQFIFRDKSRIVLETKECVASEDEVLEQHGIPKSVSPGILERAAKERERGK
jgi:S1-C subfamily serine protease